jgi:hypothetical protein
MFGSPISVAGFTPFDVAIGGNYLYVAGLGNGLRIYNIANPSAPQLVGTLSNAGYLQRLVVSQNYVYATDVGTPRSVRFIDVSNPAQPVLLAGRALTTGDPVRIDVEGNRLAVAEGHAGLEIFDVTNKNVNSPRIGFALAGNGLFSVKLRGTAAFAGYVNSIVELDISDLAEPRTMSIVPVGNEPGTLVWSNDRLFSGLKLGVVAVLEP